MFKAFKKKSGFTLIEFIIYIAIFAFVVLFLVQFLIGILSSQVRTKAREEVINNAVIAINRIDFETRHAGRVYDATSVFSSDNGQLGLVTPNNPSQGEQETYVDIFLSADGRLCTKREASGIMCFTSEKVVVTVLRFEKIETEPEGAKITITVEYNTAIEENKVPYTLETSMKVRGYY
ncbi:MAG: type II secretion system protein [Candidatus Spechtbacterales bacterium]